MQYINLKVVCLPLIILLCVCSSPDRIDNKHIVVDLEMRSNVSIFEFFEKIEIIPLETTEQSLLQGISKLICHNEMLFIHDYVKKQILIFDSTGIFLSKIDDRGQGPDQYLHISDFEINKQEDKILVLDPISRTLLKYDLTGKFINKIDLPDISGGAYSELKCMDSNIIVFWTYDYGNQLKFYDENTNCIIHEGFPKKGESLFDAYPLSIFPYDNFLVNDAVFDNNVYEFFSDGTYSIAYTWNFGHLNNNPDLANKYPNRNLNPEERMTFRNQVSSSEIINYFFADSGSNHKYRYAQVIRKNKRLTIFYNIAEKRTFVIEKTIENVTLIPFFLNDTFIIGHGPYSDYSQFQETISDAILDSENLLKIAQIKEEDNPVLIKYYFRRDSVN